MLTRNLTLGAAMTVLVAAACSSEDPIAPVLVPPGVGGSGGSTGEGGGTGGASTSTSTGSSAVCGNAIIEGAEECDPPQAGVCDDNCMQVGGGECTEANSYDPACESSPNGGWCWDGGDGGPLFCGCEPQFADDDCPEGRKRCNPETFTCEPIPDCGADGNEDNDSEAMATALSGTAQGASCTFDDDWFSFAATSDAMEVSATWTDDGNTDLDIYVTDCAGNQLGAGESGDPAGETLNVTGLTPSETYCAVVVAFSSPNGGVGDAAYTITTGPRDGCFLDSDCTGGQVCPFIGPEAGVCAASAPSAGCGDDVPADNDTSTGVTALTSGVPVTEGSCDGEGGGGRDVDWFSFTLGTLEDVTVSVNQTTSLMPGDVDVQIFDASGYRWGFAATENNPDVVSLSGLPAGTYYAVVWFFDLEQGASGPASYDITVTTASGTGCGGPDDCAGFPEKGACNSGVCEAFAGNGGQEPGEFCDSADDCNPATTGSPLTSSCWLGNDSSADDNGCIVDCTAEADCTGFGMHCFLVQQGGVCLPDCVDDDSCPGNSTCNAGTGVCM